MGYWINGFMKIVVKIKWFLIRNLSYLLNYSFLKENCKKLNFKYLLKQMEFSLFVGSKAEDSDFFRVDDNKSV